MRNPLNYLQFLHKNASEYKSPSSILPIGESFDETAEMLLRTANSYSYALDYRTGKYIFFSDTFRDIADYPLHFLENEGVKYYASLIHKNDWEIINDYIFKAICKFLFERLSETEKKYRFIFNYRLLKANGEVLNIRQINNYVLSDRVGRPLVNEGICTVIPYPVQNDKITYLAQIQNSHQTWENEDVKTFIPDQTTHTQLSPSELKVLHWIKNGYNSQKIADKLNRSLHTVKTHRKNMLEKTQCKNTAELLQYSLVNGLV